MSDPRGAKQLKAIVQFSGGAASFCAAQRAIERYGRSACFLLFCDTKEEDEDTKRAVRMGAKALGCPLIWLTHPDHRDGIWGLFESEGVLGSGANGICSRVLKRELARGWINERHPDATVVIGMTWEEPQRFEGPRKFWAPSPTWYPMAEEPWLTRQEMIRAHAKAIGFVPFLYDAGGFANNNCSGACVKQGIGGWLRLMETRPEVYARWEEREELFREAHGDFAILRDRTGGVTNPLPLRRLREHGHTATLFDPDPAISGSCGCFTDADDQATV